MFMTLIGRKRKVDARVSGRVRLPVHIVTRLRNGRRHRRGDAAAATAEQDLANTENEKR